MALRLYQAVPPHRRGRLLEGDVPASTKFGGRALDAITVPQSEFMQLAKISMFIYYGDKD